MPIATEATVIAVRAFARVPYSRGWLRAFFVNLQLFLAPVIGLINRDAYIITSLLREPLVAFTGLFLLSWVHRGCCLDSWSHGLL